MIFFFDYIAMLGYIVTGFMAFGKYFVFHSKTCAYNAYILIIKGSGIFMTRICRKRRIEYEEYRISQL